MHVTGLTVVVLCSISGSFRGQVSRNLSKSCGHVSGSVSIKALGMISLSALLLLKPWSSKLKNTC